MVSLGKGIGGDNVYITSEHGRIIGNNNDVLVAGDLVIDSSMGGDIVLSSFLQGAGNRTYLTSAGGDIKVTTINANWVQVDTSGAVAMTIVLLGIADPVDYFTDKPGNYTTPGLTIMAQSEDVKVTSLGAALDPTASTRMQLDISTSSGDVAMEIGGGAFQGNYSLTTSGHVLLEDNGQEIHSHIGVFDNDKNDKNITGLLVVDSDSGDVSVSFLPKSL